MNETKAVLKYEQLRNAKAALLDKKKTIEAELKLINESLDKLGNELLTQMVNEGKEFIEAPFGFLVYGHTHKNNLDQVKAVEMLKSKGLVDDYLSTLNLSIASFNHYPAIVKA